LPKELQALCGGAHTRGGGDGSNVTGGPRVESELKDQTKRRKSLSNLSFKTDPRLKSKKQKKTDKPHRAQANWVKIKTKKGGRAVLLDLTLKTNELGGTAMQSIKGKQQYGQTKFGVKEE